MLARTVWRRVLGVEETVVEDLGFDGDALVVRVQPRWSARGRCGVCRRRSRAYDGGEGRRRWRSLDLGTTMTWLEAAAPRVRCERHGVVVAAVPWAQHGSRFTRAFEDACAWLAVHTSKSATAELLRVAWRCVGGVVSRVAEEAESRIDRLAGPTRIGIDEIRFKRGHRYLIVVVDHESGRLVWAAAGRDEATLERLFDELGEERCAQIELVSADAAEWIGRVVARRCPGARLCLDPFHVVRWATDALDEVRRETWNEARRRGDVILARGLKEARYALWKNPEHPTDRQELRLAEVARVNQRLYRAYLLKESLRLVFQAGPRQARRLLDQWLSWARRCRIPSFVKLARSISTHRAGIEATLRYGLSNALVESVNTKIRLLPRVAFGFRSAEALIALAMLSLGGLCPPLPGRA